MKAEQGERYGRDVGEGLRGQGGCGAEGARDMSGAAVHNELNAIQGSLG